MIVQPSAMQRVAASLAAPKTVEPPQAAMTAAPTVEPPAGPLRYSEITPEIHAALRILASLEPCYPQNGTRASQVLEGFLGWSRKQRENTNALNTSSRDLSPSINGVR